MLNLQGWLLVSSLVFLQFLSGSVIYFSGLKKGWGWVYKTQEREGVTGREGRFALPWDVRGPVLRLFKGSVHHLPGDGLTRPT